MDDDYRWARAACRSLSSEESTRIFFPRSGRPRTDPPYKKICAACPIVNFCMSYAIVHDEVGIWGGLTQKDRANLPVIVRERLIEEAKLQGWFEDRLSIDRVIAQTRPQPEVLELEYYVGPVGHEQTQVEPDNILDQLLMGALL